MMKEESTIHRQRAILVSAVIVVAFVGFLIGVRPRPPGEAEALERDGLEADQHAAPLARSNAELAQNPWPRAEPWIPGSVVPPPAPDPAARDQALASRAERRAFSGAPPTIPHPIAAQSSAVECRACHEHGATIGDRIAPAMSHPMLTMCTQCHVPEQSGLPIHSVSQAATIGSDFQPAAADGKAYRYTPDSPPQTPHSSFMRQQCRSCHGPYGHSGLQTSHPERLSCEQCHTSSAVANQRGAMP